MFEHLSEATSGFAEQTTPASLEIVDANASVSNIRFVDKDLESKAPAFGGPFQVHCHRAIAEQNA